MLSPRKSKVILLPEDRRLIELLGWDEDQYRYFVRQASTHNDIRPGEPTAFLIIPFLVKLVIGLALSYLASRLTRRQNANPPQLNQQNVDGQNIVSGGRYAPRAGFGSTQNVVELGSVIPVVFAKREQIDGVWYGGVRVNTNLLWSQLYSLGTGQLLRAVFMVSEGPIGELDPRQFAIGDNLLGTYDLDPTSNTAGRVSVYFRPGGGLIQPSDFIAGRLPDYDDGNAVRTGGSSVFDVLGINQEYSNDFCYTSKPSNQTAFGLYAPMGNNLGYRVNPVIRSTSNPQLKPLGSSSNSYVTCNPDTQGKAERLKQNSIFSSRSGVVSVNGTPTTNGQVVNFSVGNTFVYRLDSSSDYDTVFAWIANPLGLAKCVDVAQTIAGRQRQWDDSIVIGELYKFGTCFAICTLRTPSDEVFISEAENEPKGGGVTIEATFRVVKAGTAICSSTSAITRNGLTGGVVYNGSNVSHLFRAAVSSFVVDRPTQIIEIGYKSSLGIRYNGLCNFRDSYSYIWSDYVSCELYQGAVVGAGQTFNTSNLTSGTISLPEKRYSFFRVGCRVAGSDAPFTEIDVNFCVCSQTQQSTYNYLRLQFPTLQRWEVTHIPLSGWEIRAQRHPGPLILLDSRIAGPARTGSSNGFVFNYSGEAIANNIFTFGMPPTIPRNGDLGLGGQDAPSYVDAYGTLAEIFLYEEVQASATQPEHEIAYVNLICANPETPTYEKIATVGLNLRSGPSFSELNQFSVYVNEGFSATHLFPECYQIALTDPTFGAGEIVAPAQIDSDSFTYCSSWTYDRRYFFDIAVSNPRNLRAQGAEWAKLFLLDLSTKNGRFHMSPIAEFGVSYSPTALFTSGNADSVSVSERDSQERQRIRVSVKWREERQSTDLAGRGLFPVIREVTVREVGTPDTAPLVQIDMSEFCTSELHAIDVGKMTCREQRLVTHDVTIECLPDRNALEPGAIIKVGLELLAYEQPNNGVILSDGTTTTTSGAPLLDGTYDVVLWDGTTDSLQEVAIVVNDGKVVGYSNAVFCIADAVQATQTFKAQVISYNDDGNLEITASYYPLESDGTSSLLKNWNSPSAWVIEGLVGMLPPDVSLSPSFTSAIINGPSVVVEDQSYTYIAQPNGPTDAVYTYSWSGTNATIASPTSASTSVTFPNSGSAALNVTVTKTVGGVVRSASKSITVNTPVSNGVTITAPDYIIGSGSITATANISGAYTTATYFWELTGEGTLASPTGSSTLVNISASTVGTRVLNLSAVINGITYSAIKLIAVFSVDPLSIDGLTTIATGTYSYSAVLAPELPPIATFLWSIAEIPTITVAVSPSSVAEDGATNIVFTFTRTITTGSLTANYTIGGTATNGVDYATIGTTVVFSPGSATATVTIDPTTDATGEPNETVTLTIASGTGYGIGGANSATATITNDDGDPYWANVVLLLPLTTAAGFTDLSSIGHVATAQNSPVISTAQEAAGALYLDGAGARLRFASHASLNLGSADCTIEWFQYCTTGVNLYPVYIGNNASSYSGSAFALNFDNTRDGKFLSSWPSGATYASPSAYSYNQWRHIRWIVESGVLKLYIDGALIGSLSTGGASIDLGHNGYMYVGDCGWGGTSTRCKDHIRWIRITKGVARTTFPSPLLPFPTS